MSDPTLLAMLASGLIVGYVLGRVRLWYRLRQWAWWETALIDETKPWARTRIVIAIAASADAYVLGIWRRYQKRKHPPAERPAPQINPKFLADIDGPGHRIRFDDTEGGDR